MDNKSKNDSNIKDLLSQEVTLQDVKFWQGKLRRSFHSFGFINTFALKLLAIIIMTIDHIGLCLGTAYHNGAYCLSGFMSNDVYNLHRIVGRLAFPIFCYFIVEGLFYTKNILNYAIRLFIFALISQVPFSLMTNRVPFEFNKNLNVYFTLFIGLVTIATLEQIKKEYKRGTFNKFILIVLSVVVITCATSFADTINCDYAGFGILVIVIFYIFRDKPLQLTLMLVLTTHFLTSATEQYCLLALIPIFLHNHKKGPSMKYVFYAYYPVHMIALYFISQVIIY